MFQLLLLLLLLLWSDSCPPVLLQSANAMCQHKCCYKHARKCMLFLLVACWASVMSTHSRPHCHPSCLQSMPVYLCLLGLTARASLLVSMQLCYVVNNAACTRPSIQGTGMRREQALQQLAALTQLLLMLLAEVAAQLLRALKP
jgi:hypothetical protein